MRSTAGKRAFALGLLIVVSACLPGDRTTLEVEAEGAIGAILYVDWNGDGEYGPDSDVLARGVRFSVVRGDQDTIATGTTDESGLGVVSALPVGSYDLHVASGELGDSLQVVPPAPEALVRPGDTTLVLLTLELAARTVEEVREAESTRVMALRGVALNAWAAFGDSTVHVADSTGVIRAVRVRASTVMPGDTVRVVGRGGDVSGHRVLSDAMLFIRGAGSAPTPMQVSTADAASARAGALAAALVRIQDARVLDSRSASGDVRLQVDDGSGVLELVLDRHAGVVSETPLIPGAVVDATGLLVPRSDGNWQLKPRATSDFEARIPLVPISTARNTTSGQAVTIEGVALNGWATFGDGIVHLSDGTGSIRVSHPTSSFFLAGDSVRFMGTINMGTGQPVLSSLSSMHLGTAATPPIPTVIESGAAADAGDGELDAALVKVVGATVTAVQTVGAETHFLVDDGSGALRVVLDRDAGIAASGYSTGDAIDAVGVLVVSSSGSWYLKPRTSADLQRW